jgi:23S rRNA G2445 N2-methylase RlmL
MWYNYRLTHHSSPLHRRGYRLETAKAATPEDIAYSMLYAAGIRDYQGLMDPMCGSGTIAIEGAATENRDCHPVDSEMFRWKGPHFTDLIPGTGS